jgi:hypothetical protein
MFPSSCKVLLGLREVPRQKCACERASISAHTDEVSNSARGVRGLPAHKA